MYGIKQAKSENPCLSNHSKIPRPKDFHERVRAQKPIPLTSAVAIGHD